MQLIFKRDFFLRNVGLSDWPEVQTLIEKFQGQAIADLMSSTYASCINHEEHLFKVALNSNGVVIGVLHASREEFDVLSVNPNFLRKEVKKVLLNEVKEWASLHSCHQVKLAPKLITGDWKAFVKDVGIKMLKTPDGVEWFNFN